MPDGPVGPAGAAAAAAIAAPGALQAAVSAARDHAASKYGVPVGTESALIVTEAFVASFDGRTRNARWVLERLTAASTQGDADRRGVDFWEEPSLLPVFRNKLGDFRRSG